ncbi:MAG: DEAD/DEAH box helicase [Burkholderiales bacterium]|nr:DEAD/DEAH box helicase [Burkholderiales bacterium]MDP2398891.1 DEAD/DEAH box helicase [Burkholderiales bacterium]
MSFADLNLIPEIQRAVADEGYTEPTPIQAKAIPAVLERRDIMGCAQTGTGKTAGFTLPLLQLLSPYANSSPSPARHTVRALILTPTRELAAQVSDSVKTYGKHLKLRSTVVYGGVDMLPQTKALREGVEILVATPGRLLDHVQQKSVSLGQVEILVLDEADRMLDMGFLPDIRRILALLPAQRQSLLFSATFSEDIKKLANQMLRSPTLIEVARRNAPADLVDHQVYEVETTRKRALLAHLIRSRDMKQVLVFVRMKRDCNKLARELVRDGINATAIHSDRTQGEREQALADFKEGRSTVLVATDIAARGIDIAELPFVINYELPYTPEDYVHRIGRTGRAGLTGEAISLVSAEENRLLVEIEKLLKRAIPRKDVEGNDPEQTRERRPRREVAEEPAADAKPRPARRPPAPPRVASDGFDFSKPYEPTPSAAAAPATEKPASIKPRGSRPTAALLGGFAAKDRK